MAQAPTVTVVTSRLDIGGTERHLTRVLPALQRRGINIALYVMERGGPLEAELSAQGVRVEGPERARILHWPRATLDLARFLRRERPTIVHFFLPRPYVYGSMAAEMVGHRRRIMSRRSLTDYRARYPLLGRLERWLHGRTTALIGNSMAVIDQLRDRSRRSAKTRSHLQRHRIAGAGCRIRPAAPTQRAADRKRCAGHRRCRKSRRL